MRGINPRILKLLSLLVIMSPVIAFAQFSVLSEQGPVQIHATDVGPVLIVERRDYPLPAGTAEVIFDFASTAVQPESVRVETDPGLQTVRWLASHRPVQQNRLVWRLSSETQTTVPVRLSYLLDRLEVQPHYRLIIDPSEAKADLEGRLAIRNESGASFPLVELAYEQQPVYQGALLSGETRAVQWKHWTHLPLQKVHVWDSATQPWEAKREQSTQIPVELRLQNDAGKGLGATLPSGKYRVFQENAGTLMFLGEARLPVKYPSQQLALPVMSGRDLLVTQHRVRSVEVNPRPNAQRPRLVDVEEQLKTTIDNRQDRTVQIELVQHLDGQWETMKSSHPFTDRGEGELRFPVTLAAGESITVTFDYRLRNLRR